MKERTFFYKMCVRWLRGNRHDAEDVLSKGAINAFEYVRSHPGVVQRFRPWMLKILYNLSIDAARARARCADLVEPNNEEDEEPQDPAGRAPEVPDQRVFRDELAASIAEAAEALPPKLQEVFALRFLEEMRYEEISQALMISPQNARKRIQLVRELLRVELRGFVC